MIRTTSIQFPVNVSGVGFQLKAADGSNIGSRVTIGVVNVATGVYMKQNVDTGSAVLAFWNSGDGVLFAPDIFSQQLDDITTELAKVPRADAGPFTHTNTSTLETATVAITD